MERAYERRYVRAGAGAPGRAQRRGARGRQAQVKTGMSFRKKIAVQFIACAIIGTVLWGINITGTAFAGQIKQTMTAVITGHTNIERIYNAVSDMSGRMLSMLSNNPVKTQESSAPADTQEPTDNKGEDVTPESGSTGEGQPPADTAQDIPGDIQHEVTQ